MKKLLTILLILAVIFIAFWFFFLRGGEEGSGPESGDSAGNFPSSNDRDFDSDSGSIPGGDRNTIIIGGEREREGTLDREPEEFYKIPLENVASVTTVGSKEFLDSLFYMIEKTSGDIYSYDPSSRTLSLVLDNNIPNIRKAWWGNNLGLIIQYLSGAENEISTYVGQLTESENDGVKDLSLSGKFIDTGIRSIDTSPDTEDFAYVLDREGGSVVQKASFDKPNDSSSLLLSAVKDWVLSWSGPEINLTTRPSGQSQGFSYGLNPNNSNQKDSNLENILINRRALSLLSSPDGEKFVFSISGNQTFATKMFDRNTGEEFDLTVKTFPEKCVWSSDNVTIYCAVPTETPNGVYPDLWYLNLIEFSDRIISMNTETGFYDQLLFPQVDAGENVDVSQMFLSEDENFILFTNKLDDSLWVIDQSEEARESTSDFLPTLQ